MTIPAMWPIKDGKLVGVKYVPARIIGETIKPSLIVIHDTAGRLEKGNSVKWFQSKDCKVSAHVIIERDGTVTQMVPFDRKAAHCGQSQWKGRTFCNSFAIGIEIVNPGQLDDTGRAWFGETFKDGTQEADGKRWLDYTPEQIEATIAVCRSVCEHYAAVDEIVGHRDISPGRKVDPTPMFPWQDVDDAVFDDGAPVEVARAPDIVAAETKAAAVKTTAVVAPAAGGLLVAADPTVLTTTITAWKGLGTAVTDTSTWAMGLGRYGLALAAGVAALFAARYVINRWGPT